MLLLDSEALSAVAHGPAVRRDRVRALIAEMRRRDLPVATVAAVLAEVVRGRPADSGVFAGLRVIWHLRRQNHRHTTAWVGTSTSTWTANSCFCPSPPPSPPSPNKRRTSESRISRTGTTS